MSERTSENKARQLRRWSVILGVIALVLCLTGAVLLGIGRHAGDTAAAPSATTGASAASAGTDAAAGAAARPSVSPSPLGEPTGAEADMDTPVTASPGVGNADWDAEAGRPSEPREDTAPLPQHPGDDAPTNVRMPGVGLNLGVVSEDVRQVGDAWQMNLPVSSAAGWLSTSANLAPGATGSTVIAGHVNFTDASLAPMSRITQAQTGMEVLTTDTEGDTQRWRVTESKSVSQTELSDVFHLESGAGARQLLLVTCELGPSGAFDHNRVVIAEPA